MTISLHSEIKVCQCCLLVLANGECCAEDHEVEPLALWADDNTVHLAIGGEHNDECPNKVAVTHTEECDCENKGFRRSPCEGCGIGYDGDRYAVTVFYKG